MIQAVDGVSVATLADVDKLLDTRNAGDLVKLTLWREGRKIGLTLALAAPKR